MKVSRYNNVILRSSNVQDKKEGVGVKGYPRSNVICPIWDR